jgi:hypothetical protein
LVEIWTIIVFVISLVISTVIIYFITKVFGEREGIKYAFLAAISGSIIYGIFNNIIGNNIITSIIGGVLWWFVLKIIYRMKWLKALLIAFIIWVITSLIGFLIPTLPGPL